jgi:hypothetical protein
MVRGMLSTYDSNKFSLFTKKIQFFLITVICIIPSYTAASVALPENIWQIQTGDSTSLIIIVGTQKLDFSYFQIKKQQAMTIGSILINFYLDKEQNPIPLKTQTGKSLGIETFNFSKKIVLIPDSYMLSASDLVETLYSKTYKVNKASWSLTTISIFIFASIWFMISAALVIFGIK